MCDTLISQSKAQVYVVVVKVGSLKVITRHPKFNARIYIQFNMRGHIGTGSQYCHLWGSNAIHRGDMPNLPPIGAPMAHQDTQYDNLQDKAFTATFSPGMCVGQRGFILPSHGLPIIQSGR